MGQRIKKGRYLFRIIYAKIKQNGLCRHTASHHSVETGEKMFFTDDNRRGLTEQGLEKIAGRLLRYRPLGGPRSE